MKKIKADTDTMRIADVSSNVAEHFNDYVVIGRIKDGLVWRYSDRTFALGATARLNDRLAMDDRRAGEDARDEENDDRA